MEFSDFKEEGKYLEERFAKALTECLGGVAIPSKSSDGFLHVGMFWMPTDSKIVSFEVRPLKVSPNNKNIDPVHRWIEFNVSNGDEGWVNGDADYIVFEGVDDWLIIRRRKLLKVVTDNITNTQYTNDRTLWLRYYRSSHSKGKGVKVPTNLIRKNADKILIKRDFIDAVTASTKNNRIEYIK